MPEYSPLCKNLIMRINIVSSHNRYDYTIRNEQLISCTTHGDQPAYRLQLPGFVTTRNLCRKCLIEEFPEMKLAVENPEKPVGRPPSPFYMCCYGVCQNEADYHDMCTFCRDYFCPEHLDKNDCCPACVAEIGGENAHESMRNSMRGS